ncbi:MAG: DUF2851 family protein [Ignavibacterium sp.]|nr:DUF2851 family protein [Ignavibacterium sp.]MDW8376393.1 DUF2851 family protein [Ignavibacteriales bacterium]
MKNFRIPEDYIYDLWMNKKLPSNIQTVDGTEIEIIDPGIRNSDFAGPDFHNARIRIGNITFNGDVEIDNFTSDWKAHGHYLNSRYNKTILHVVLKNNSRKSFSTNSIGRDIPVLELKNYLDMDKRKELEKNSEKSEDIIMPCIQINHLMEVDEKIKFIRTLGLQRYKKKCLRILDRLKELVVLREHKVSEPRISHNFIEEIKGRKFYSKEFNDITFWNQVLYEEIFEALGYTKNKEIMQRLGKSLEYDFIQKIDSNNFIKKAESALFSISGLIPPVNKIEDEETLEYVRELNTNWQELKVFYNNNYFHLNNWHFYKLRPQNFPTVRLAAAAKYLHKIFKENLFNRMVNAFSKINDLKKISSLLYDIFIIKAEGYWAKHYNFSKPVRSEIKYFVGLSRVNEIVTNCILPILSVYFEIFDKKNEAKKVVNLFVNYTQKESNSLIDKVSTNLHIYEHRLKSVLYQGMLELFRGYCIKGKCLECEIGKKIFS